MTHKKIVYPGNGKHEEERRKLIQHCKQKVQGKHKLK